MKMVFYKTVSHYFPKINKWINKIKDPRQEGSVKYNLRVIFWVGIFLFLLKLGSRRQINYKFNKAEFIKNLSFMSKKSLDKLLNDKTLADVLKKLSPDNFAGIVTKIIKTLIRFKVLEKYRLDGYCLITMDGTGHLTFRKKHCKYCLQRKIKGETYYFHPVLDCKLVTSNGMALNVGTEFIENTGEIYDKQDCELKAFYRCHKRLKRDFPQLKICLLLDSLFANQNVMDICEKNNWKYFITFKKGSIPTLFNEFETLKKLSRYNAKEYEDIKVKQAFSWVNEIDYEGHLLNVLECIEYNKKSKTEKRYVWITNFNINKNNCHRLVNKGGRLRWKIENEGFNMQKNGGYEMEHAYSENTVASKNFYILLQISHIFNQLIEKGSLLTASDKKRIGSIKNITFLLLEDLRTTVFNLKEIEIIENSQFQIRFDSS